MKSLVVYYSKSGKTKRVAEAIAGAIGADLEEVKDAVSRRGPLGFLRSGRDSMRGVPGKIHEPKLDPARYDLVVLGAPVWGGAAASPLLGYLALRGKSLPQRVAFFCTQGGENPGKTFPQLEERSSRKPLALLQLRSRETSGEPLARAVKQFVSELPRA